jgi:DNA polymerase-3 subunit delta
MCEYRLVVVRGLLDRFEPLRGPERIGVGRSRQPKSEIEEWLKLLDFVSNLPPSTVLVLLESKLTPGKNLLFDAFSPFAEVTMKGKLGRDDVHRWINDRVREKDGSINEQAVNMLEQLIGDDLWTIENEIEKLLAYRRNSQIDLDDVRLLVSESREVNVFNLVDAILEGIPGKSQKAIQHFISDGESPLGLLSMVCRQLRTIAVATALESGISSNEAALRLGIKPVIH